MKVLTIKKDSSLASFALSAFIHVGIVVSFGVWGNSQQRDFNLVKIPNAISINLSGNFGDEKGNVLKTQAKSKMVVSKAEASDTSSFATKSAENTQSSSEVLSSHNGERVGKGGEGSVSGVAGGTGHGEAELLSMKQKYFLEFRGVVESKKEYPAMARMRGIEGIVVVAVTIKKNGEVGNHRVVKASGFDVLDHSALGLVKKITLFKSIPDELGNEEIELKFPIAYSLNG